MLLYLLSLLLVFISSYLFISLLRPKNTIIGMLYLWISMFAQAVFTIELLSFFSLIKPIPILILNLIFLICATILTFKTKIALWKPVFKPEFIKIFNALRLDKSLIVVLIGYLVFITVSIILNMFLELTSADAADYHVVRSLQWVVQGNLLPFETADIRNLIFPINSEILYAWAITFTKNFKLLGFYNFFGYVAGILSLWGIMSLMGTSVRKKLWAIFLCSSFSSVIIQISGTETDMIISGCILSTIYLFWYTLKNKIHEQKSIIYMASLAGALSIGVKSTALIAFLPTMLLLTALSVYYLKKDFYKPLLYLGILGTINFIIFSSYIYIINLINYSSPFGSVYAMQAHSNIYGLKGMVANFIKNMFLFLDSSGFKWGYYLQDKLLAGKTALLSFLHLDYIPDGIYSKKEFNYKLIEPSMGAGILGILIFIPCMILALIKPVFCRTRKNIFIFGFALLFVLYMLTMSCTVQFMSYNVRFIATFLVITSPILLISYSKNMNVIKFISIAFMLYYFVLVSTHLWPRDITKITKLIFVHHEKTESILERALCSNYDYKPDQTINTHCVLRDKMRTFAKGTKFLVVPPAATQIILPRLLHFQGYKVDLWNIETIEKANLNNYDVLVLWVKPNIVTNITSFDERWDEVTYTDNNIIVDKEVTIPCIYLNLDKEPISDYYNTINDIPFKAECTIRNEFIENNNLEIFDLLRDEIIFVRHKK